MILLFRRTGFDTSSSRNGKTEKYAGWRNGRASSSHSGLRFSSSLECQEQSISQSSKDQLMIKYSATDYIKNSPESLTF